MLKALYYPHTEVGNETVLKNALLLWDSLETISPRAPRPSPHGPKSAILRDAAQLVVRPRQPNDKERQEAHTTLEEMVRSGQLASILARAPDPWRHGRYLIYPDKFLHETWHMLEAEGLGRLEERHQDFGVPPALGFLMMSLLADSCAGTQIQKVTDRTDAYSWLAEARATALGSAPVYGLDASQVAPAYDRLVSISLEVLDARQIPLSKLLEFRQREANSGSTDYASMRRRYLAALDAHIKRVTKEAKSIGDLRELERQFRLELRHDLNDLKSELGVASLKTLFSKEVAISALITAGTFLAPIPGLTALSTQIGLVGIIPLMKSAIELRGARRAALLKHTSSWLYLAKQPRIQMR